MTTLSRAGFALLFGLLAHGWCPAAEGPEGFSTVAADPNAVRLVGPEATWSLLVTGLATDGTQVDLTRQAIYQSRNPEVASVSSDGRVRGVRDGRTAIDVAVGRHTMAVAVEVVESGRPRPLHFENDVMPILGRYGCNSSGCHGKAEGQGGFKLSVFGFDPTADYAALIKEGRGRRVFPAAPDASLLLLKASGRTAHGGGTRVKPESEDFAILRTWVAAGGPVGDLAAPRVESIRVDPAERVMGMRASQQVRVVARYTDGRETDVTTHARFQVNNEGVATVSAEGLVTTTDAPGDVAVMAAYMGQVGAFRAFVPRSGPLVTGNRPPQFNFIDEFVDKKLAALRITPSPVCDDATFLRRATLDLTGTLPTAAEARRFLADTAADKRTRLVDDLLARPEFADLMALKWADVLRVDRQALGHQRAYAYYRWLRESFATNKPFDQLARELVTADGLLAESGPANFYKVVTKPGEMANTLSQVFLGVRIACAECHHHPYDRWAQTDYAGMVAYFAPVSVRGGQTAEALFYQGDAVTQHPRTKESVPAHALGTVPPFSDPAQKITGDRRVELAVWMTNPSNPYFARNAANRVWAHLLGRGLVEPVDDARATNPPTNPELLDALARSLVERRYDLRALIRVITQSRVYQTSTAPNETNDRDEQNYSRGLFKRPDAEVLLDMIGRATGAPERFPGSPAGIRAVQLWDSKARNDFLKLFGRPVRASACECERSHEPSVAQVLNLLNSPAIEAKLSHPAGTVVRLSRQTDDAALVDELYLTFFTRLPTRAERERATAHLHKNPSARVRAVDDLAWAMLNSLEFAFNH
ncbi:DUF1549 domain-containing protein [Fimbriiglobus ruber]|uniref:BIG2 domain-containing protein n=1 Tax=Fimbriiglobus ruber TaxID=1908690 RepID=A0A225E0P5_9BACT|nr:DUF1549 domain-containing protein [Fimbriiglobus ruber]OWK44378.1 hypothetical protein FRUB_02310 [Fimbriiglobus ruber]